MLSANFKPTTTAAASRGRHGFLATGRLYGQAEIRPISLLPFVAKILESASGQSRTLIPEANIYIVGTFTNNANIII